MWRYPRRFLCTPASMLRADAISIAGSTSVEYVTRCDTKFIFVLDTRE
jgi:hypothetical protein